MWVPRAELVLRTPHLVTWDFPRSMALGIGSGHQGRRAQGEQEAGAWVMSKFGV